MTLDEKKQNRRYYYDDVEPSQLEQEPYKSEIARPIYFVQPFTKIDRPLRMGTNDKQKVKIAFPVEEFCKEALQKHQAAHHPQPFNHAFLVPGLHGLLPSGLKDHMEALILNHLSLLLEQATGTNKIPFAQLLDDKNKDSLSLGAVFKYGLLDGFLPVGGNWYLHYQGRLYGTKGQDQHSWMNFIDEDTIAIELDALYLTQPQPINEDTIPQTLRSLYLAKAKRCPFMRTFYG